MRKRVAWPGVAVKSAKGRRYHYWTRSDPWTRLPDPAADPDGFMRKLAHLQRVNIRLDEAKTGTLADTARLYQKHPDFTGKADSTQRNYAAAIASLLDIFPGAAMAEITPQLVQRFVMDEFADTPIAANMKLRVLHILFKWAGKRRAGLVDPTNGIEEYRGGEHQPWPDHLLERALSSDNAAFRLAVALHLYTGQRTGDVCMMTWNAITADGRIPVKQQKTKTPLLIPVHPQLADLLRVAPRSALTILTTRRGGRLAQATFLSWVKAFGVACGAHLVPHGLRKNAVNALLEAECSTAEVSSITGQSLAMVEHYAKKRNQGRIASAAMLKWSAVRTENGKTGASEENRLSKGLKA